MRPIGIFSIFLLTALLAGCSPAPPLTLAFHPFPGYGPAHVAETLGLWPRGTITVQHTASATDSIRRLERGEAQAALLTLDEVLRQRARGLDLRVVLLVDRSLGADALLCRKPLPALSALRGLRIGHEDAGVNELLTQAAVAQAGLRYRDIVPVHIPYDRHAQAWQQRDVDCLATFYPVSLQLEQAGAVRVFDSAQAPNLIWDVLAVRAEALETHQAALHALVQGWFEALAHLQTHEEDTRWRLAPWLMLDPAAVSESFDGVMLLDAQQNRMLLDGPDEGGAFRQAAAALAERMARWGMLPEATLPARFYDAQFLPPPPPAGMS